MQVLPRLFKLWLWVDLDPFYAKVRFGFIGFCMRKSENYYFFGNYCSLRSQSCLKHSTKWVNEVEWISKVKVILWLWSKVTQISKLKLVFHRNSWAIWNQSSYESWSEYGNENLYKWVGSHDQHGHNGKNLKKSFSPEAIDWWPWNFFCSIFMEVLPKLFKLWPWVDLDPFYAKVKSGHIGFCMGKSKII